MRGYEASANASNIAQHPRLVDQSTGVSLALRLERTSRLDGGQLEAFSAWEYVGR